MQKESEYKNVQETLKVVMDGSFRGKQKKISYTGAFWLSNYWQNTQIAYDSDIDVKIWISRFHSEKRKLCS